MRLEAVRLEAGVRRKLAHFAEVRGRWHGGALFGTQKEGEFRVSLATPHRVPSPASHPLDISLSYLVGVGDTFSSEHPDADWAGTWIAAPDGRLPSQRDDLLWLRLGGRCGLFSEHHPLVVVGVEEGYLEGRAYLWDEGEPLEIDVRVGVPEG
ncbi:hypothetical protein [uncultured Deinococcus sp.]|uniref:hypothetical protein n=1 Tax=uncultured Deinococcus sp. TaxID=158789 RepID=UPI0025CDA4CE|nr:hypothetical protein [uncultured Deinococcus sp.]